MKSNWQRFRIWLFLAIPALFLMAGTPAPARSDVGVSLSFNFGPPPALVSYPSDLVLIPGTEVYFAPVTGVDLFFHGGNWWSHRGPKWYRSYSPDGPWIIVERRHVPGPLYGIPHDYRAVYRHGHRVPFGHWKGYADHKMSLSDRLNLYREWHYYDRWGGRRHDRDWYRDRWDGRYGKDGRDHRYFGRDRW